MEDGSFTEPVAALIAAAHAAGFADFSEPRLKRLRLAGLMRDHRRIGNEWLYPTGSTRQLLGLLTIEREYASASFAELGWQAWRFGWQVHERYWWPVLEDAAALWDRTIPRIRNVFFDEGYVLRDGAFNFFDKLKTARVDLSLFRQLRKRLTRYLDSFLIMIFKIGIGTFAAFAGNHETQGADLEDLKKDSAILDRGLGLDGARKHRLPGIKPWLSGDISLELEQLSESLSGLSLLDLLSETNLEELHRSRDQLILTLVYIANCHESLKKERGPHAFGFGAISKFLRIGRPTLEAAFVLLFHAAKRDPRFAANVASFLERLSAMTPKSGESDGRRIASAAS
jgi:hypothetical protein